MYKVIYSKFIKTWMVVAPNGIAQSSWKNLRLASQTASSLNRRLGYDNPSK